LLQTMGKETLLSINKAKGYRQKSITAEGGGGRGGISTVVILVRERKEVEGSFKGPIRFGGGGEQKLMQLHKRFRGGG